MIDVNSRILFSEELSGSSGIRYCPTVKESGMAAGFLILSEVVQGTSTQAIAENRPVFALATVTSENRAISMVSKLRIIA